MFYFIISFVGAVVIGAFIGLLVYVIASNSFTPYEGHLYFLYKTFNEFSENPPDSTRLEFMFAYKIYNSLIMYKKYFIDEGDDI